MHKQPVKLSVGKMELPSGVYHACYIGGEMREIAVYEISKDNFRVRWDTIINGWQYTVSKWVPGADHNVSSDGRRLTAAEFAKSERESTRRLLIDLAATGVELEAKIVQFADHLRPK